MSGATLRVLTAAVLVAAPVAIAAPAEAVAPPAVDRSLLPPPAPPAPPWPAVQREQCFAAAEPDSAVAGGGQLAQLDLDGIWRFTRGAGQTVAVIDTGVARHRLLPHLVGGGDYVSGGDGTDDCDGHGTLVAGIIGAAPAGDDGFRGLAPDATILSIRQSSTKFRAADDPGGAGYGDVDTLARAVRTAADLGATVINVSSVACLAAADDLDDRTLGAALAYAVDVKNVVVVAAAGNVGGPGQCPDQNPLPDPARPGGPDWAAVRTVASPGWYDDLVLTVGSVGPDGLPSRFTLAGPWVDVAAPGEQVMSLAPAGEGLVHTMTGADQIVGTSYAAPVVSGVVALVRARSPQLTARQVMQRIEDIAHAPASGWDPLVGHGVVDPLAAVTADPAAASAPTRDAASALPRPAAPAPDGHGRRLALGGAALCCAVATVAAGSGPLRRRREGVADD